MKTIRYVLQSKDGTFYKSNHKRLGVSFDEAHIFSGEKQAKDQQEKLNTYYAETTYTIQPVTITL